MNTERIRIVLSVLDTKSIRKTAEIMGYSPSGVSKAVTDFEKEIGICLITRTKHGIYLTEDAAKVVPLLSDISEAEKKLLQLKEPLKLS